MWRISRPPCTHVPPGPACGRGTALTKILLNRNELSGAIPASLGQCSQLRELYLSNNHLSGAIPAELGRCSLLTTLSMCANELACCPHGRDSYLPAALDNCTGLSELKLDLAVVPNQAHDLPAALRARCDEGALKLRVVPAEGASP